MPEVTLESLATRRALARAYSVSKIVAKLTW